MIKRILDISVASLMMFILIPAFIVIAVLIKKNLGSPIIFQQIRPGLNGKLFKMYKFRTMKNIQSSKDKHLSDNDRLSLFGQRLRSMSLDELPELWNVLKGDMSLVGPRPLLKEYLEIYNQEQKKRHDVKPGITGWAQINGRNLLSWNDKFKLDIWYVENHNIFVDIKILVLTLIKVINREGVNASKDITMEKFSGD
jgi:lipopolysaccharide/colanic/teichoic acid biosynthesis glycosyltransferase